MDSNWFLLRSNMEREKNIFSNLLAYFKLWSQQSAVTKMKYKLSSNENAKLYLPLVTLENIFLTVCGFVNYSEYMFANESRVYRIYSAHSNQSSIENSFSITRHANLDRTDLYASSVLMQNSLHIVKKQQINNKCYPMSKKELKDEFGTKILSFKNNMPPTAGSIKYITNKITISRVEVKKIIKQSNEKKILPTNIVSKEYHHENTEVGIAIGPYISNFKIENNLSYQNLLCNSSYFTSMFILFNKTFVGNWFHILFKYNVYQINNLCQSIMSELISILEISTIPKNKRIISFELNILNKLQNWNTSNLEICFSTFKNLVRDYIRCKNFEILLVIVLKDLLRSNFLPKITRQMKENSDVINSVDIVSVQKNEPKLKFVMKEKSNNDVNRFVGWAIYKVKYKYECEYYIDTNDNCNSFEIENILHFLDKVSVKEINILGNIKYIQSYYPVDDAIRNKGNLTLISPDYVLYFAKILNIINFEFEKYINIEPHKFPGIKEIESFINRCKHLYLKELYSNIYKMSIEKNDWRVQYPENTQTLLLNEIVSRILNAKIGKKVKEYRNDNLKRVNDVAFLKTLAVKSRIKKD